MKFLFAPGFNPFFARESSFLWLHRPDDILSIQFSSCESTMCIAHKHASPTDHTVSLFFGIVTDSSLLLFARNYLTTFTTEFLSLTR